MDSEKWSFANVQKIEVSEDNASVFVLMKVFPAEGYFDNKSVIYRYDFVGSTLTTLVDGQVKNGDKVSTDSFTLTDAGIVVFNREFDAADAAYRIDYAGMALAPVANLPDLTLANLDVSADGSLLYTVGYKGVSVTDIATQVSEPLSLESEQELFQIDQIRSVHLDEPNNRLLIGDDGFDYVLAVDTETGERSEFSANGVGVGKRLIAPRAFVIDGNEERAFLLDDGGNAKAHLIQVDLATGDRSIVTAFGAVCNYFARDLIFDRDSGLLYAVFESVVYKVSLADGTHSILAGDECGGAGFALTGAELDPESGKLMLTDTSVNGVMTIDLATGTVDTLVQSEEELDTPVSLALDQGNGLLYILSQAVGGLHSYNLETGELKSLFDGCLESSINDILGLSQNVVLDPTGNYLWISGDGRVGRFNLLSPTCQADISNWYSAHPFDVQMTSKGQLLSSAWNQLMQIDFDSGKSVTISK